MPRTEEQLREIREKTKRKILDNALTLFANKGFHGTSMNDIAKAAGVSKGLAYNYFESKEKLVDAIFVDILSFGDEIMREMNDVSDPYKQLEYIIEYSFNYVLENESYWQLFLSFGLQPEIFEKMKIIIGEYYKGLFLEIERIFSMIGVKDPVGESRIFGSIIDGVLIDYFLEKETYPLERTKKLFLKKYSKEEIEKNLI